MNPNYPLMAQRARHRCEYCNAPEFVFNFPFEVEHIVAIAQGGADVEPNWALAYRSCNIHKGTRTRCLDPVTDSVVRLFHPRQDG